MPKMLAVTPLSTEASWWLPRRWKVTLILFLLDTTTMTHHPRTHHFPEKYCRTWLPFYVVALVTSALPFVPLWAVAVAPRSLQTRQDILNQSPTPWCSIMGLLLN